MKITSAKVIVCSPGRNFVTLKIETDEGLTGIGDATLNGRELSVVSYLEDHVIPCLIGRDAHQIATDGSKKILPRWTPPALDLLQHGQPVDRLAFAAAAWMRFCLGQDEQAQAYTINDPLSDQLQALARTHAGNAAATVQALGTLTRVWGEVLPRSAPWLAEVTTQLEKIRSHGMLKAAALLP